MAFQGGLKLKKVLIFRGYPIPATQKPMAFNTNFLKVGHFAFLFDLSKTRGKNKNYRHLDNKIGLTGGF